MALLDLTKACLDSITQIADHIEDAVVYLDSGCTESFQLAGAFPLLLDLGARAVCSLENPTSLDAVVDWNSYSADHARKIVVITSRLLSDAHRYVLRCLSTHKGVSSCTIFTSISEIAHSAYPDSPLGPDAFHEYESLLLQDYEELVQKYGSKSGCREGWSRLSSGEEEASYLDASQSVEHFHEVERHTDGIGQQLFVSVHHFPMVLCPLSPRVYILPSEGSIAEASLSSKHEDSLSLGLPRISTGVPLDGDDVPPGALLTAHFLYHLAAKMDLKMEIFSLGDLSKAVGKIMTNMSSLYDVGRRKRSAGLLLIDRTLDLLTPCCHKDSLVDRMFSALPRRKISTSASQMKGPQTQIKLGLSCVQRAPLDVQIPLPRTVLEEDSQCNDSQISERIEAFLGGWDSSSPVPQIAGLVEICNKAKENKSTLSEVKLLKGSFVSTETFRGIPYMEAISDRKMKDGAVLVKKWLQEALRRENLSVNVKFRPGFATRSELQAMVKALAESQSSLIRNKGIIQLASAVVAALDELHSARWDAFNSAEKILNASAGDTSQSLAGQIGDLINKSALVGSNGNMDPSQGLLSTQDALLLMIVGYILAGENFPTGSGSPFSWQEEHFLKEAIMDAFLENRSASKVKFLHGLTEELEAHFNWKDTNQTMDKPSDQLEMNDFDDDQWGRWGDEEEEEDDNKNKEQSYAEMQLKLELRDRVDNLFKLLHKLSVLRWRNVPLREGAFLSESNFGGDSDTSKGLIYKLLTKVIGKCDIPGLDYHSSTVGRLFKSGFGRFGLGQAKPSLGDQNVIMVFVIGGINGIEVLEAHEAVSESGRPDIELILGGTTLLTPNDMLDLLTGESSYL